MFEILSFEISYPLEVSIVLVSGTSISFRFHRENELKKNKSNDDKKMMNAGPYNPYNPRNRLFTRTDIQTVLSSHNCDFDIRNQGLYQTAMIHSSYVKRFEYTTPTGDIIPLAPKPDNCIDLFDNSYELLEHLGDSVLGSIVSTYLYKRFPNENEGFLTDLKKDIVCNEMLGSLSKQIGLDKFYIISRHNEEACNGRTNVKKLGDILEAFIGALWMDCDNKFDVVFSFMVCLIERYINIPKLLLNNRNYKEQLQKYYQGKFQHTPKYTLVSLVENNYTMSVSDEKGNVIGTGTSTTKKTAEQMAAKEALDAIKKTCH